MPSAVSIIKQNLTDECQAGLNGLIGQLLASSYTYKSMQVYFDRDDVKLPGFSAYFKRFSDEEFDKADRLMRYLNERGGRVSLASIQAPARHEWETGLSALTLSVSLKKAQNAEYLKLQAKAELQHDAHLCDFMQNHLLRTQVDVLKELSDHVTALTKAGAYGLSEYIYDSNLKA